MIADRRKQIGLSFVFEIKKDEEDLQMLTMGLDN